MAVSIPAISVSAKIAKHSRQDVVPLHVLYDSQILESQNLKIGREASDSGCALVEWGREL